MPPMENYPTPARALVADMTAAAAVDPARAVAFQGAPGANSHLAVAELFPDALVLPCFDFPDAFDAVVEGRAGQAVIPIENSLHGRVADIHFLLPESGLKIVGEHFLRVRHCLLATDATTPIAEAMSHPQALGQCRHWLRERGIKPVAYTDTAAAAAFVAENRLAGIAAIAPALAASLYGLEVRAEGIEDEDHNMTRFVVLAREPRPRSGTGPMMTTLIFEVLNVPAALYKALGGFATNGVNITKLESYQPRASFSASEFYADIEGSPDEPNVARALAELDFQSKWVRLLGTYPQERSRSVD
jgi:prephenate dehydratase